MTTALVPVYTGLPELVAGWSYDELVTAWRDLDSFSQWVRGDLALLVGTGYGDNALGTYAADVGEKLTTMQSYRTVAKAWPPESRHLDISWSVHQALASQADRLELVASREGWTLAEARAVVKERKDQANAVHATAEPAQTGPTKAAAPKAAAPKAEPATEPGLFEVGGKFITRPYVQAAIGNLAALAPRGSVSNALKQAGVPGVNYYAVAAEYRAAHPGTKKLTTGECVLRHLLELTGQAAAHEAPSLASENAELRARVAALTAENDQLRAENAELRAKLSALDDIKEGAS